MSAPIGNDSIIYQMIKTKYAMRLDTFREELRKIRRPVFENGRISDQLRPELVRDPSYSWIFKRYRISVMSKFVLLSNDHAQDYRVVGRDYIIGNDYHCTHDLFYVDSSDNEVRMLYRWFIVETEYLYDDFRYYLKKMRLGSLNFTFEEFVEMFRLKTYKNCLKFIELVGK